MLATIAILAASLTAADKPLALHPDNPHYLLFRGKPTILIGSTEHYGAVLNLDFNGVPYLDELKARGLNLTRTFSGTYREVPGSFKIQDNTLAPAPGRDIAPWSRSNTPGASDGGNRFDLDAWNDLYFRRLKAFLTQASERGIVVEYVLFCPFYEEAMWAVDPMNGKNNINGVGDIPRTEAYTLKHPDLLAKQLAFVKKAVAELKDFDNLYYEICNEPYFGGVTLDWQERVAATIAEAEKDFPHKHLIAQNIANDKAKIDRPNPAVSIFNFHYATPPETVGMNYGLNKPIADDETGFRGTADRPYRTEAWEFLLAGGAIYDNLDYSFTAKQPDGTAKVTDPTPGGGGPAFRRQMTILKEFLGGFDFIRMAPDTKIVAKVVPDELASKVRVLSEPGKAYAAYLRSGPRAELTLDLPAGKYRIEWVSPLTGAVETTADLDHRGGQATLKSPDYPEDIALRVVAASKR